MCTGMQLDGFDRIRLGKLHALMYLIIYIGYA